MPKKARELKAIHVRRIKRPGLHAVGGVAGLNLQVAESGARSWVLRVKMGDKRRDVGCGGFPDVSLQQARERARDYRDLIEKGIDPVHEKKARRQAIKEAQARNKTFWDCALAVHAKFTQEFRNKKHKADWLSSLRMYALPRIGRIPVADIGLHHIKSVLDPIWIEKTETATRVRQRIERVLDYAKTLGYRSGDNPAVWNGNLEAVLPKPSKVRRVKNLKSIPWRETPAFIAELRKRQGMAARALEFCILTATRSGEVRGAVWDEIDLKGKQWVIPASRMKAQKAHHVPLSARAIEVLKSTPRTASPFVFWSSTGGALSDMALLSVLRRMEADATVHGFRSCFKDWARSMTRYADEVSELALAHVNSDQTRSAYARDMLLPQRAAMMGDWARFCEGGTVVKMRAKA